MTKEIRILMTAEKARSYGYTGNHELVLVPVDIDLDSLSPAARWIAEHITATRVLDEWRDRMPIIAEDSMTRLERDRASGKPEEKIRFCARAFGRMYTEEKDRFPITFPIYGRQYSRPEEVIETTAKEVAAAKAGRMYVPFTEEFCF